MLDDFVLIKDKFYDVPQLNIYPLGDAHIGSKECNVELLKQWVDMVQNDPLGRVVIIGDMMNMGLKNSKSNVSIYKSLRMRRLSKTPINRAFF